jgi:hypothetical protein
MSGIPGKSPSPSVTSPTRHTVSSVVCIVRVVSGC